MKTRLLWIAIAVLGLAALYCGIVRPHVSTLPKAITDPMAEVKPPLPPPIELPPLEVPPIPTIEPPPLKMAPLVEPNLRPPGSVKDARREEKP